MRAVTLDAMGTLLELDDPVPRLAAALSAAGFGQPADAVVRALRAEIAHYRANLTRGGDLEGLAVLRTECAAVLAGALEPPRPPVPVARDALAVALRFRPYPETASALDLLAQAGARLAVVSDWDVSLHETLSALGLSERIRAVVTSAEVGARKPDPRPFHVALRALGAGPAGAWHIGDAPDLDGAGARAAGMEVVVLDRAGRGAVRDLPTAPDLLAAARLVVDAGLSPPTSGGATPR